jgi:hypothetical protein
MKHSIPGLLYHEDEGSALLRNDDNIHQLTLRNIAADLNLKLELQHQRDVKRGSLFVTSGFRHDIDELCALLGYYEG